MAESGSALPIHPKTISNLNDKLYEKRKLGALEVEEIVKQLQANKDQAGVNNVIAYMVSTFANSSNPNSRKGGLIGLAAIAIGLGSDVYTYLPLICPPVLRCFTDLDSRVRYYACESLYNIAKISRGRILPFFNEIFDGLCKLAADPDLNVKNGAQLLDRLMKDIVIESNVFEVEKFIPLLRDRVHVVNPFVRQFLIGWLNLLDSVPDIDLVAHLPSFLGGLFNMLADPKKEIKREAETTLGEFLKQLRRSPRVNVAEIVKILLPYCSSTDEGTRLAALNWINEFLTPPSATTSQSGSISLGSTPTPTLGSGLSVPSSPAASAAQPSVGVTASSSQSPAAIVAPVPLMHVVPSTSAVPAGAGIVAVSPPPVLAPPVVLPNLAQNTAPISAPVDASGEKDRREELLPFGPELLSAILLGVSHEASDIQFVASKANAAFLDLLRDTHSGSHRRDIALGAFLTAVVVQFLNGHVATRLAALEWTRQLHAKAADKFAVHSQELFPALLKLLSDPAEEVVRQDLAVMGIISTNPTYFDRLMQSLISLFATDPTLLEKRGTMIVRQLSLHLDAQRVFRRLSVILEESSDEDFAVAMVQTLNIILLTSSEFLPLRASLKSLHASPENKELFVALYRSWSHNPSATLALCLLSQQYSFAYKLIQTFAELEVTVNFLIEIDKLVQLLESPIFTCTEDMTIFEALSTSALRLQLLEPEQHPDLFKALYGVLMLLPQSAAYETLKSRLNAISSLGVLHLLQKSASDSNKTNAVAALEGELLTHFLEVQRKHAKRRKEVSARAQLVISLQQR